MKALGFVFPGQGSQSIGMLADMAHHYPEIEKTYAEASDVLGYNLWQLIQEGPAEKLNETVYTQPALLTASYAIWRILQKEHNFQPRLLAGHSLGEYTALVCAGALEFTDGVKLVAARGKYMQAAVPAGQGALAVFIGLEDDEVERICAEVNQSNPDEIVTPANFNSIGQVVIAGHIRAVEEAMALAKAAGSRLVKLLPVSVPSHCQLMQPAAEQLKALLDTIPVQIPLFPVIHNVDAVSYQEPDRIRDALVRQLVMPVRWVEVIKKFVETGISHIVECGPDKVLTGLNKRITTEMKLTHTANLDSLQLLLNGFSNE